MSVYDEAERLEADSLADWSAWLDEHHSDARGVWLVMWRGGAERPFDYEAAVCEALRYGWVDAVRRTLDAERTLQWFAPRRSTSGWSRSNKRRVAQLEREGRLEPAGRAAVDAAKANGAWERLDTVESLVVPDDLAAAFERHPGARAQWDGFPPSARKQMLAWVVSAKRPATREQRIADIAEKAGAGQRARG